MTKFQRSLANQKITLKSALIPDEHHERDDRLVVAALLLAVGIIIGMFLITALRACDKPYQGGVDCMTCHRKVALTEYFRKNGSKSPEEMAYGVLQTRNPRLLSAVAVVESGGNPGIRNAGYKRRHHGAFQVNPKYHGAVPTSAVDQALQAEKIIEGLTGEKGNITAALNAYGGDSKGRYARVILAELGRTP